MARNCGHAKKTIMSIYITQIVSAPQMDGNIIFKYDLDGHLRVMENNMKTDNPEIIKFFATHVPFKEPWLIKLFHLVKERLKFKVHVQILDADLSFQSFWDAYNYKKGKFEAEREWNKLNEAERILVFKSLPRYNHYLQTHKNQDKVWANRYLKKKRYLDEE
jgi:hypothetical protein